MSVKSASRAVDIVEHIARAKAPQTAQQLGEALDIPASSLSYLLSTLVARGWLAARGKRAYVIGATLNSLLTSDKRSPAERAAAIVRHIRMQLNETCGYFERQGQELVALVSETGQQDLGYTMKIGQRGPLHAFAAGKAILAFLPRAEQEAYLSQRELLRYTPHTLSSRAALRRDLALTRSRGYALSVSEHTLGLTSIAVPVELDGGQPGAISIAIPSVRFDETTSARALDLLRQAQRRLTGQASGTAAPPAEAEADGQSPEAD